MFELENRIVNLTPHPVTIIKADGTVVNFPPTGNVARVFVDFVKRGSINGIDVVETVLGGVYDLPPPKRGTTYVVSRMVLNACPRRWDLVTPHNLVRDYRGVVLGARCFVRK